MLNLLVELDAGAHRILGGARSELAEGGTGIDVVERVDDCALAWIDQAFGGAWSSEAYAGSTIVARRGGSPIGFATFDAKGLRYRWLRGVAAEPGVGIFGPMGVEDTERRNGLGTRLAQAALEGLRERGYARAVIPAVREELVPFYAGACAAKVVERYDLAALTAPRPRVVALVSGAGTNLQAVLDAAKSGELAVDVVAVISNNARAYALERARRAGVPSVVCAPWRRQEEERGDYDVRLHGILRAEEPDLVLLLGWMHLLPEHIVRAFPNTLNVHPAFLPLDERQDTVVMPDGIKIPAFRGPHAVRDALAAKSGWVGATVHAVTPATDRGPVFTRKPLCVNGETEAEVMECLHPVEHRLIVGAVRRWLFERP